MPCPALNRNTKPRDSPLLAHRPGVGAGAATISKGMRGLGLSQRDGPPKEARRGLEEVVAVSADLEVDADLEGLTAVAQEVRQRNLLGVEQQRRLLLLDRLIARTIEGHGVEPGKGDVRELGGSMVLCRE